MTWTEAKQKKPLPGRVYKVLCKEIDGELEARFCGDGYWETVPDRFVLRSVTHWKES